MRLINFEIQFLLDHTRLMELIEFICKFTAETSFPLYDFVKVTCKANVSTHIKIEETLFLWSLGNLLTFDLLWIFPNTFHGGPLSR